MRDRLKEEVEKRRQEFDASESDFDQLWQKIEPGLERNTRWRLWKTAGKVAASLLLVSTLGWLAISYTQSNKVTGYALHEISPEMAETEYYYSQLVAEKLEVIAASNADVDKEVINNLQALDSAYVELKKDLKENVDNQEVISAMISNYRIKLSILEQILSEIKQHDQKGEQHEVNI